MGGGEAKLSPSNTTTPPRRLQAWVPGDWLPLSHGGRALCQILDLWMSILTLAMASFTAEQPSTASTRPTRARHGMCPDGVHATAMCGARSGQPFLQDLHAQSSRSRGTSARPTDGARRRASIGGSGHSGRWACRRYAVGCIDRMQRLPSLAAPARSLLERDRCRGGVDVSLLRSRELPLSMRESCASSSHPPSQSQRRAPAALASGG